MVVVVVDCYYEKEKQNRVRKRNRRV